MIKEKLFLQFLGYLWYLVFFVILLPILLYYLGSGIDYLVFTRLIKLRPNLDIPTELLWPLGNLVAVALFGLGVALIVDAAALLWRDGGTFPFSVIAHKHSRPEKLITHGLYGHVRHPMLLGYAIALVGIAIYLRSPTMVFWLVPLMVAIILEYLHHTEEKNLARWFGPDYQTYQQKTALIIPKLL